MWNIKKKSGCVNPAEEKSRKGSREMYLFYIVLAVSVSLMLGLFWWMDQTKRDAKRNYSLMEFNYLTVNKSDFDVWEYINTKPIVKEQKVDMEAINVLLCYQKAEGF